VGSNEHSVGLLGVPVEEFELDLDHVVEALAPLVDVVVAAVTAVHFAGGLKPPSVNAGYRDYGNLAREVLSHRRLRFMITPPPS
jgi:hypothetical protein